MTDQELNVKIANACGWTYMPSNTRCGDWFHQESRKSRSAPPDFISDLNASRVMRQSLTAEERLQYVEELAYVVGAGHEDYWEMVDATAAHHAAAFARVKGWV